jgi:pimeloyl-ACP methyl ester carboxylesterase
VREKYVFVDGLKTRYVDEGSRSTVLLLHGASLGSCLDVYEKNIPALASAGLRLVAYDSPGYGLTDNPKDFTDAYRTDFVLKFMDSLDIAKAHVVAHSAIGRMPARIALTHPERLVKVVALAATPLLPPLGGESERGESEMSPPTLESTRERLEGDLFNHSLITRTMLERRLKMSVGKNFDAAQQRVKTARSTKKEKDPVPLWQSFAKSAITKFYLLGKNDRRGTVEKRCSLLAEMEPGLNIHLIDNCNHLIMIDARQEFDRRVTEFLLQ